MRSYIDCGGIFRRLLTVIPVFVCSLGISSCDEFLQVPVPDTELVRDNVFIDDATATAAIINIYSQLSNSSNFAGGRLSICEGAYADELMSHAASNSMSSVTAFYFNNIVSSNDFVSSTWATCYSIIYSANLIIEGLSESASVSTSVKNQILGEAFFMRAFCHFYLVNLYGNVPLITTSDYRVNAEVHRAPVQDVYLTIITDLMEAKVLLTDNYPTAGRVRVNKGAAIALLARTYLYIQEFENAEAEATEIISKSQQYKLDADLDKVFLKTSEEAIWQLLPNGGQDTYTYEGLTFILVTPPTNVSLRSDLVNSFESGDLRKEHWIDSLVSTSGFTKWYFPVKYKENYQNATSAENSMVLRLAEQYLIRAEARARQGKLVGLNSAQSDLNVIRTRAGLPNTSATTDSDLLTAIEHERRMELFTEWGHRFFDLRRTDRINEVLALIKPNWNDNNKLLPIPQSEILSNPNLEPQNPGY